MHATMELANLHNAILQNPDSIQQRLAYSSYLKSIGDVERAEFIDLQCEYYALDSTKLSTFHHEDRIWELVHRNRAKWADSLIGVLPDLNVSSSGYVGFRRGFVEGLMLSPNEYTQMGQALREIVPLTMLIVDNRDGVVGNVGYCSAAECLESITVNGRRRSIDKESLRRLVSAPHLHCLRGIGLSLNAIEDTGAAIIGEHAGLQALRELYLNDNYISDDGLEKLCANPFIENLEILGLGGNFITDKGVDVLMSLELPHLKVLDLSSVCHIPYHIEPCNAITVRYQELLRERFRNARCVLSSSPQEKVLDTIRWW